MAQDANEHIPAKLRAEEEAAEREFMEGASPTDANVIPLETPPTATPEPPPTTEGEPPATTADVTPPTADDDTPQAQ